MWRHSVYYASDNTIEEMINDAPITAAVSATRWRNYKGGVMKCAQSDPIDHAVLLVGYTSDYWIAKNSWGNKFGDNGYIYISRERGKNCSIGAAVHELS